VCTGLSLLLIAAVGIATSLTAWNVVNIAFKQMGKVQCWWDKTGLRGNFPPLSGSLPTGWFYAVFSTGRMPFLLVAVWSLLAVLVVIGVGHFS
jgi:hypothetical protein